MTANPMHWNMPSGSPMTYKDATQTPVPRRTYRCPATASERSEHNINLQRKHACKITVDHDGDHQCICGMTWERKAA
ncbi:hypothetical protein [Streptomyces sp. AC495_CC817]|uniref:hypothetical protein n=1 Tax=Streptomyces sp. AC495_CC817 TaxID=2823900 RepID=UPI001C279FEA|nr:hypothetical protein [Streptomyces sp. AC495_CC817]